MIVRQHLVARRFVAANLAEYGESPRQPLDAITYDEAQVLGDWLPDLRPCVSRGPNPRRR